MTDVLDSDGRGIPVAVIVITDAYCREIPIWESLDLARSPLMVTDAAAGIVIPDTTPLINPFGFTPNLDLRAHVAGYYDLLEDVLPPVAWLRESMARPDGSATAIPPGTATNQTPSYDASWADAGSLGWMDTLASRGIAADRWLLVQPNPQNLFPMWSPDAQRSSEADYRGYWGRAWKWKLCRLQVRFSSSRVFVRVVSGGLNEWDNISSTGAAGQWLMRLWSSSTISSISSGSGGVMRIVTAYAHGLSTGDQVLMCVGSSSTGNIRTLHANEYVVTVINATTLDLQGTVYGGSLVGGGLVGITGQRMVQRAAFLMRLAHEQLRQVTPADASIPNHTTPAAPWVINGPAFAFPTLTAATEENQVLLLSDFLRYDETGASTYATMDIPNWMLQFHAHIAPCSRLIDFGGSPPSDAVYSPINVIRAIEAANDAREALGKDRVALPIACDEADMPYRHHLMDSWGNTLTLGATSGSGVSASTRYDTFAVGDVGKVIASGAGRATISAFVSAKQVTVNITVAFAATSHEGNVWTLGGNYTDPAQQHLLRGLQVWTIPWGLIHCGVCAYAGYAAGTGDDDYLYTRGVTTNDPYGEVEYLMMLYDHRRYDWRDAAFTAVPGQPGWKYFPTATKPWGAVTNTAGVQLDGFSSDTDVAEALAKPGFHHLWTGGVRRRSGLPIDNAWPSCPDADWSRWTFSGGTQVHATGGEGGTAHLIFLPNRNPWTIRADVSLAGGATSEAFLEVGGITKRIDRLGDVIRRSTKRTGAIATQQTLEITITPQGSGLPEPSLDPNCLTVSMMHNGQGGSATFSGLRIGPAT